MLVGNSLNSVAGGCYAFPDEQEEIVNIKKQRMHVRDLLDSIQRLSFSQFERFGARILVLLDAGKANITPHAGDQGIDFYGQLSLGQYLSVPSPFMKLAHDVQLLFTGQAKHYPRNNIGPSVIRELIGSVGLARSGVFSKEGIKLFDEMELKPFAPVVTMLFTTGGVTSGARQLAASAGIIVRSGEQLALFLADCGIGMTYTDGLPQFDPQAFEDWIKSPR